jgi:hypothetical protein
MRNSSTVRETNARKPRGAESALETDPLLSNSYTESSTIRERRKSGSNNSSNQHFDMSTQENEPMHQPYSALRDDIPSRSGDGLSVNSSQSGGSRSVHQLRRHYVARGSGEHPPLLEIPEEIYSIRKSALSVLKPLTRTWVSGISVIQADVRVFVLSDLLLF